MVDEESRWTRRDTRSTHSRPCQACQIRTLVKLSDLCKACHEALQPDNASWLVSAMACMHVKMGVYRWDVASSARAPTSYTWRRGLLDEGKAPFAWVFGCLALGFYAERGGGGWVGDHGTGWRARLEGLVGDPGWREHEGMMTRWARRKLLFCQYRARQLGT